MTATCVLPAVFALMQVQRRQSHARLAHMPWQAPLSARSVQPEVCARPLPTQEALLPVLQGHTPSQARQLPALPAQLGTCVLIRQEVTAASFLAQLARIPLAVPPLARSARREICAHSQTKQ